MPYKPMKVQATSVNVAKPITTGTKKPAIRSAVCCIGAYKKMKLRVISSAGLNK